MSRNIYDMYRRAQARKDACYNERSAAFIVEGKMSLDIFHKRLEKEIKASLVFNHKEGPDEVLVYTLLKDDVVKSDYFIYNNVNYLIYEENKLTDEDIPYRKQKAVECNVTFQVGEKAFVGYFKSGLRSAETPDFEGKAILNPSENPILILPTNNVIDIQTEFVIEGRPFKVVEYDHITNRGITYYYIERTTIKTITETSEAEEVVYIENDQPINQEEVLTEEPDLSIMMEEPTIEKPILRAMMEYTFETRDAIFSSTPAVEIVQRRRNEVTFRVPFGISEVAITTKINGELVEKFYKVVS